MLAAYFPVDHAGHQNAGIGRDHPPRLEQQPAIERRQLFAHDLGIEFRTRRRLGIVAIGHAEAAARIDEFDVVAGLSQKPGEIRDERESICRAAPDR